MNSGNNYTTQSTTTSTLAERLRNGDAFRTSQVGKSAFALAVTVGTGAVNYTQTSYAAESQAVEYMNISTQDTINQAQGNTSGNVTLDQLAQLGVALNAQETGLVQDAGHAIAQGARSAGSALSKGAKSAYHAVTDNKVAVAIGAVVVATAEQTKEVVVTARDMTPNTSRDGPLYAGNNAEWKDLGYKGQIKAAAQSSIDNLVNVPKHVIGGADIGTKDGIYKGSNGHTASDTNIVGAGIELYNDLGAIAKKTTLPGENVTGTYTQRVVAHEKAAIQNGVNIVKDLGIQGNDSNVSGYVGALKNAGEHVADGFRGSDGLVTKTGQKETRGKLSAASHAVGKVLDNTLQAVVQLPIDVIETTGTLQQTLSRYHTTQS